jgi:NADP-dependent 3-hydroxy acid dehydrogenase YdfG
MKLADLVKNMSNMSADELREHVRQMRHNKIVVRPASVKRADEVDKKEKQHKNAKVNKTINSLSPADKAKLIAMLQADKNQMALPLEESKDE